MLIHEHVGDVTARLVNFVLWKLIEEAGAQGRRSPHNFLLEVGVETASVTHDDRRSTKERIVTGLVILRMNDGTLRRFSCKMVWTGKDYRDFDTDSSSIKEE